MAAFSLIIMSQQNRCHGNGFGDRAGHAPAPETFERDNQIDRTGTQSVELLRYAQRGDAQVGQLLPHLAAGRHITGSPSTDDAGQVGGAERRVDAGREVALLFVECEFHGHVFSRGSPSSRSAMMLRWISLVPA
ncbi:Uncharacterised protein [Mycobacterium tuberculosis]|nr:Uncharacterised protein [Mycobacterium tuberculosis]